MFGVLFATVYPSTFVMELVVGGIICIGTFIGGVIVLAIVELILFVRNRRN